MSLTDFLWTIAPSIVVSVFMFYWNKGQKKRTDSDAERELDRLKAQELQISLLVATAAMGYANSMAIKRGTPNGEVEEGIAQYQAAMAKFREFEREQLAKNVAK